MAVHVCNQHALINPAERFFLVFIIITTSGRNCETSWLWVAIIVRISRWVMSTCSILLKDLGCLFPLRSCLFYSFRYSLTEAVDLKEEGELFQRSRHLHPIHYIQSEVLVWLNLQFGEFGESRVGCWLTAQNTVLEKLFQFITLSCFSSFFSFSYSREICLYVYKFTDDLRNFYYHPIQMRQLLCSGLVAFSGAPISRYSSMTWTQQYLPSCR